MTGYNRRQVLALTGGTCATGVAGCLHDGDGQPSPETGTDGTDGTGGTPTGGGGSPTDAGGTPTLEARPLTDPAACDAAGAGSGIRVANMVPDVDSLTIEVGGQTLDGVPYTGVCDRVSAGGSPAVTVTADGRTVFDDAVSIPGDDPRTLAITGEAAADGAAITPVAFDEYQGFLPGNGTVFQVVHAVPDAPRLTVRSGGAVNGEVADGISFGEAALPRDDRDFLMTSGGLTISEVESGDRIARFSGSFSPGTVFTLFLTGYLTPGDDAGNGKLAVVSATHSG
jgi:hypothetical protein